MAKLSLVQKQQSANGIGFTPQENRAAQRAVLNLFQKWNLSLSEQVVLLGGISERTLQRWRAGSYGNVNVDLSTRLSIILGIHKSLRVLFDDLSRVYDWVKRPNSAFGGVSALDVMLNGRMEDLFAIRKYLDAQRGAW